jgi:hypothetical protein
MEIYFTIKGEQNRTLKRSKVMNSFSDKSRVLGAAFLLQAVSSLVSGAILLKPLIVEGNIINTMTNISNNVLQLRANILGEMITAFGIIFLGVILFVTLRKQNEKIALIALGFYILEAVLLAVSRISVFFLLRISQEYVTAGNSAYLQTMGKLAVESENFTYNLAMLAFCFGGILFYYLLYKSGIVPRALSLWGLITTVFPCLIATLSAILGYKFPFFMYLPYAPFEFTIGVWILVKGIKDGSETKQCLASAISKH